jgi:transcriptional regulator with XRE-family HTH domain
VATLPDQMKAKQRRTRDQQIVELRNRGLTLEAIAQQFGLTRERVRQITKGYHIPRRFVTIPKLMAHYDVSWDEVVKAIEAAGLHKAVIIADADVQKVVQHLTARRARGQASSESN